MSQVATSGKGKLSAAPTRRAYRNRRVTELASGSQDQAHELIGSRLRAARLRSGLGVRDLSRQLNLSASSISQIELGRIVPSVSTLYALTNALNVSMDSLFVGEGEEVDKGEGGEAADLAEPGPGTAGFTDQLAGVHLPPATASPEPTTHERSFVLRRHNRRVIDLERGVRWELLTPFPEPGAEFLEVLYPVGSESSINNEAMRHNGRDYCLVLEGELGVQIGFEQYALSAGDSMAFDGTIPHRLWNRGDIAVRAVWFVLDRSIPHGARIGP